MIMKVVSAAYGISKTIEEKRLQNAVWT